MSTTGNSATGGRRQRDGPVDDRGRLQRQARALGNANRFAIFQHVAKCPAPVRVATLVERFELNHNAVRQHLAKLCEAELLVEEFAPRRGPGRPALQYRVAPEVAGAWGTANPYEQLAFLALEMASEGMSAREVGIRAGRRAASELDGEQAPPLERTVAEMRRQGFEPRTAHTGGGVEITLDSCPFTAAAAMHPDIVCEIHRGLVEGFVEELGADLKVTGLHVGEPGGPGCNVRLGSSATTPDDL